MSNLSQLTCGNVQRKHSGLLAQSLWHLSRTLTLLEPQLRRQGKHRRPADRLIVPFLIRSLIEIASTSLIARIDPFRILTLAKIQDQATYDPSKKVASALQWQGDVVSNAKTSELWEPSRSAKDMSRSLLGDYQDEIFWQPAYLRLLDYLQRTGVAEGSPWLIELMNIEPSSLAPRLRGTATKIYSAASKGVHHEFVLSISSYYDNATLDQLTEDVIRLIADMALVANFSEYIAYGLTSQRAISQYRAIQP